MTTDVEKLPAVQQVTSEIADLESFARDYRVTTAEQYQAGSADLQRVKAAQKRLEETRTGITGPMNAALKRVNEKKPAAKKVAVKPLTPAQKAAAKKAIERERAAAAREREAARKQAERDRAAAAKAREAERKAAVKAKEAEAKERAREKAAAEREKAKAKAAAEKEKAKARAELEKERARRKAEVEAEKARAKAEREQAREEAAAAKRAEAERIAAELETVRWRIEQSKVRSPVDGILYERAASEGHFINLDERHEIASVIDPRQMQVWVDINQRDLAKIAEGRPAAISLDAEPGRKLQAKVDRILPKASLAKNTVRVILRLEEFSPALRPEMSVKVEFAEP